MATKTAVSRTTAGMASVTNDRRSEIDQGRGCRAGEDARGEPRDDPAGQEERQTIGEQEDRRARGGEAESREEHAAAAHSLYPVSESA